jgi:hypothetical protein
MKKLVCLLMPLALLSFLQTRPATARPHPPAPSAPPFAEVKGAFFALSVADLDASANWYAEKLGLAVNMRTKSPKTSVIVLSGNGLTVELLQNNDATDLAKPAELAHGFVKAGLVVEHLDKTLAELKARNVKIVFGPYPAKSNSPANFIIQDNASNLIQFFAK